MQHIKVISLALSVLFVVLLTNITVLCMEDANSTNNTTASLNITEIPGKNLPVKTSGLDGYVEGYDPEPVPVTELPDSQDFAFSKFDMAAFMLIIGGIGSFCVAAVLTVFLFILKSTKKKKN